MTISLPFILISTYAITLGLGVEQACGFQQLPATSWRRQMMRPTLRIRSSSSASVDTKHSDNLEPSSPSQQQKQQQQQPQTQTQYQLPDMEAYAKGFKTVFQEIPFQLCPPSFGELPRDLVGTYFRCGPAMFSAGSIIPPKTSIIKPKKPPVPDGEDPARMVTHPFEGDGAVVAITFPGTTSSDDNANDDNDNNMATLRFRYVRTTGFTIERKRGERLYKAMDSTRLLGPSAGGGLGNDIPLPLFRHHLQLGLNKNRKNTSNTRVVYWAKRLLTLWEGGLPYKLDSLALSTEGKSQLGGVLFEEDPFGAKMVVDPVQNRAIFYRNKPDATSTELTVFEFDINFRLVGAPQQQGKDGAGGKVTTKLPGLALLSDFAATSQYTIFVQPAVSANPVQFLVKKEPGKVVTVDANKPAILHLIPRWGINKPTKSIPLSVDAASVVADADWQFCNAYEDRSSDRIVLDVIRSDGSDGVNSATTSSRSWPWITSLDDFAQQTRKKSLWRYMVDVKSGSVVQKTPLSDVHCGFGVINPAFSTRPHRFIYMAMGSQGSKVVPLQGIGRLDCESRRLDTWMPQNYEFCGEPMYAPRQRTGAETSSSSSEPNEDDGYILSLLFNGKTEQSELIVLRASDVAAGPIARLSLGLAIPHGLFGCFSSEASRPHDEIQRRAKLADKMESRGSMWNEVKSDFSGLGLRLDDIEEILGI